MLKNMFDVIVVGVGSMGSSTCYYLAKQGIKVLGLEQFSIPNEMSSHTGQSRIIRKAYFEHPDYVPLLVRAYQNWSELEATSGIKVYYRTGLLYAGLPDHIMMKGVRSSAEKFEIKVDKLRTAEVIEKYPGLKIPSDYEILFEPDAGFLTPEKVITAYVESAIRYGAVVKSNVKVNEWRKVNSTFEIKTATDTYYAKKLIFTTGPWAGKLLPQWSSMLRITRQVLAWFPVSDNSNFQLGNFPCWLIADGDHHGVFYGFPVLKGKEFEGPVGLKMAHHFPGTETDPDLINRTTTAQDEKLLVDFMHRYFRIPDLPIPEMKTCMYTNTPDEDFILDFLPGYDKDIIVATGFSGHGFKFASVIGEIMRDMAVHGETPLPTEFLRAGRF